MRRPFVPLAAAIAALALLLVGCTQAAPAPTPTKAPAAPTKATEPAKAATAQAAPTKAAEPTKAAPQPTTVPAKKVDFPQKGKTVTWIVPFAAGGSFDTAARLLVPNLEKELGTTVEIVNKPGASTQTAATELARARPDGYTLGSISLITTAVTYLDPDRKAVYTRKDFAPIAHYVIEDNVLVVKADSPLKNVKDLVDAAKAKPGQVKVGSTSLMGVGHLAAVALELQAGAKFAYVHFDGNAPAMTALLGGHVDVAGVAAGGAMPHEKSGAARVIGYFDDRQSKFFPNVKPVSDLGYKVASPASHGIAAPAGTPKEVVEILSSAIKRAAENPDLVKKLDDLAQTVRYMDPEGYTTYWTERENQAKPLLEQAKQQP